MKFAIFGPGGVGEVTRQPMDVVRSVPETRALLRSAIGEVLQIAHAKNVALPDDIVNGVL